MASSVASRDPSPVPRSRPRPPPPPPRSSSQIAAPTLSRLTTRSSSASRLYTKDYSNPTPSSRGNGYLQESRTSLNGKRDKHSALVRRDGKGSKDRKGKAVTFVVGITGSSEEGDAGDAEGDSLERATTTGASLVPGATPDQISIPPPCQHARYDPTVEEIIRSQIRQPVKSVDSLDLDSLLPRGIADYSFSLLPPASARSSLSNLAQSGDDDGDDEGFERVSLGKGKFSEVLLVRKGDAEFALKHTPLHPHHPLIANRLLREPTILAQLLPHPNLVKVFETIRTPGHFYLVEESLRSSITLEAFVTSSPGGVLPLTIVRSILDQLSSVVRSLHEPLRVVHRDIKPENILIRVIPPPISSSSDTPPTVVLKLLDFGLATHFSASEPKLTTCCGSPAYHSPELWKGLREPSGTVPYWGPEIDIWCIGLTILRTLSATKYPIGTSHASLQAMSDKVVDALLAVPDPSIRHVLSGYLNLSSSKRMKSFERYCATLSQSGRRLAEDEESATGDAGQPKKEFKSTTFIPADLTHRLQLPLDGTLAATIGPNLEATVVGEDFPIPSALGSLDRPREYRSASPARENSTSSSDSSRLSPSYGNTTLPPVSSGMTALASTSPPPLLTPDLTFQPACFPHSLPPTPITPSSEAPSLRHLAYPPPIEVILLNPTNEPVRRAISYIKYSLRCAGVLYHVRDDTLSPHTALTPDSPLYESPASLPPTPFTGSFNLPSSPDFDDDTFCSYLQCVAKIPPSAETSSKASSALIAALRPPLSRAHTSDSPASQLSRASTTPAAAVKLGQRTKEKVEALTFYVSIRKIYVHASTRSSTGRRNSSTGPARRRHSKDSRIVITLSDDRALSIVREALAIEPTASTVPPPLVPVPESSPALISHRGRKEGRSALSPRSPNSGSRDARQRREDALQRADTSEELASQSVQETEATGLKMDMGPRRSTDDAKLPAGGGLFDIAGFVGRLVGSGTAGASGASTPRTSKA